VAFPTSRRTSMMFHNKPHIVAVAKANSAYKSIHANWQGASPFLSPFFVYKELFDHGLLKSKKVAGLIDYGSVDIPELLATHKNISLSVVVPNFPELERIIRKQIGSCPVKFLSCEEMVEPWLIRETEHVFYDFYISFLGKTINREIYPKLKLGGLAININLATSQVKVIGKERSLIITGCTRGATTYISHILRHSGIGVRHDQYGHEGIVGGWAVPAIYPPESIVIHQTRNPIGVIRSLLITSRKLAKIYWYAKDVFKWNWEGNILRFAMQYWYDWNVMGEERAAYTYPVERLEAHWDNIKHLLSIPEATALPDYSKESNTFKGVVYPELSWDDLFSEDHALAQKIADLAIHLGYEVG